MRVVDVPASSGLLWIKLAWTHHFKRAPFAWIGLVAIWSLSGLLIALTLREPGLFVFSMLHPTFFAGFMAACREQDAGGVPRMAHLFHGFRHHFRSLLMVAWIGLLLQLMLILLLSAIGVQPTAPPPDVQPGDQAVLLKFLSDNAVFLFSSLSGIIFINAMLWFAPVLIAMHGMKTSHAVRWSLFALLSNVGAMLVFGIAMLLIVLAAMLTSGLGMIVVMPMLVICVYTGYKSMFVEESPPPEAPPAD